MSIADVFTTMAGLNNTNASGSHLPEITALQFHGSVPGIVESQGHQHPHPEVSMLVVTSFKGVD